MKTLSIRYSVPLGGEISYQAFEKDKKGNFVYYDVEALQSLRYIGAEYAVPKDKALYEKMLLEIKTLENEKLAKEKLADNIKNLDSLKQKEEQLKKELSEVSASIKTVETALAK